MKTENRTPKDGADNKRRNIAMGAGGAIGGAAGIGGAAIFATQEAEAATQDSPDGDNTFESADVRIVEADPAPSYADEPKVVAVEEPTPEPEDSEVEILGYERVDMGDGELADIAVLNVDGHAAVIMDSNLNGEADYIAVDYNDNGAFEDDESRIVTGQGFRMQPLQQMYAEQNSGNMESDGPADTDLEPDYNPDNDPNLLADGDMSDFINDADVSDFDTMA